MTSQLRIARLMTRAFALVAAFVLVACSRKESAMRDTTAAAETAAAPAAPPAAPAPNDAQIAHIAVTANSIDSTAGAMAVQKGSSKDVKDFGRMMVRDHGAVNKEAVALAKKLNLTPEDNETSRNLMSSAEQSRSSMQGMTGAAFDRAYIDNEVTFHQTVLDALDKTLIPNAQNAELKALLEKVRPNIAGHLERARQIQSTLGATP